MDTLTKAPTPIQPLVVTPAAAAALGLAALVATALALQWALGLGNAFVYTAAAAFGLGATAVAVLATRHGVAPDFGAANTVTLLRAGLVALLIALAGEAPGTLVAWCAIGFALSALLLDGVDGKLARSRGTASAFGARFDMETDALLILVLTVLAWQFGKAGVWIVAGGLLRYAFVLAGLALAWLRAPLPYRRRRQTVCVVQVVSLLVCLAPFVVRPLSDIAAALGLIALLVSFAIDIVWLAKPRH